MKIKLFKRLLMETNKTFAPIHKTQRDTEITQMFVRTFSTPMIECWF